MSSRVAESERNGRTSLPPLSAEVAKRELLRLLEERDGKSAVLDRRVNLDLAGARGELVDRSEDLRGLPAGLPASRPVDRGATDRGDESDYMLGRIGGWWRLDAVG